MKNGTKQSMQNTNRQSMIQSILEESDGYDDDIMDDVSYNDMIPPIL